MKGDEKIADGIMSEIPPEKVSVKREFSDVRAEIVEPLFLRQAPTTIVRPLQIE